jgi:hypothetical protein
LSNKNALKRLSHFKKRTRQPKMKVTRKKMVEELKAIEDPALVNEGDLRVDSTLRVISGEGAYRLEVDEFPIDGPFEISDDEFNEISRLDLEGDDPSEFYDITEDQMEMFEAGCDPGVPYFRYQMNVREEGPVFNEDRDELEAILVDDVMDIVECNTWEDMSDTELEEWYNWHLFADK